MAAERTRAWMENGAAPSDRRRAVVLAGVAIDALTMDETVEAARVMVRSGRPHQQVGINAALLVESERHPELRRGIEQCDLVSPDGMSLVWMCRLLGQPVPERVAGIALFQRPVEVAERDGASVYFIGATHHGRGRGAGPVSARHTRPRV